MKVTNYIASMIPSFRKGQLEEDIRVTKSEIKEHTEPSYADAASLLKKWDFKHPDIKENILTFNRLVKHPSNENMIVTIHNSFKDILENLDNINKIVDRTFNEEIASSGINYRVATVIQFVEWVSFVSKYSRKYLIYLYICETSMYEDAAEVLDESLSPAELDWLQNNFVSFCTALNVTSGNPSQVSKQMADIPEVTVTAENVDTLHATLGASKLDPFSAGLIPVWLNPIYHVGIFVAEWQASRYHAAKEEHRLLQMRKLNLERMADKKPDAKLQQEIKYTETRIQALHYKIAKMEKNSGV